MTIEPEQLRNLPVADKLRIVVQLWDHIAGSSEPFPLRPWHEEESRRRAEELERKPDSALTRDELWSAWRKAMVDLNHYDNPLIARYASPK